MEDINKEVPDNGSAHLSIEEFLRKDEQKDLLRF